MKRRPSFSYARPGLGDSVMRGFVSKRAPNCSIQREAERLLRDPVARDAAFALMESLAADEETARMWASWSELERAVLVVTVGRKVPVRALTTFSLLPAAAVGLDDVEASA